MKTAVYHAARLLKEIGKNIGVVELAIQDAAGMFGPADLAAMRTVLHAVQQDTARVVPVAGRAGDVLTVADGPHTTPNLLGIAAPPDDATEATLVWLATEARQVAGELGRHWQGPLPATLSQLTQAVDPVRENVQSAPLLKDLAPWRYLHGSATWLAYWMLQIAVIAEQYLPEQSRPEWQPPPHPLERELLVR